MPMVSEGVSLANVAPLSAALGVVTAVAVVVSLSVLRQQQQLPVLLYTICHTVLARVACPLRQQSTCRERTEHKEILRCSAM